MFYTFYYSDILCGEQHLDVTVFSEVSSVFGYIASFIYLFVCVQSASHLMYNINVSGAIFLGLVFHNFEPYPYHIMLNLKIYQSVVLKVVQLFPKSNLFASGLWFLPTHLWANTGKRKVTKLSSEFNITNSLSKLKTLSSDYFVL